MDKSKDAQHVACNALLGLLPLKPEPVVLEQPEIVRRHLGQRNIENLDIVWLGTFPRVYYVSATLRVSGEWVWLPMPDNPVTLESARQWCEEGGAET